MGKKLVLNQCNVSPTPGAYAYAPYAPCPTSLANIIAAAAATATVIVTATVVCMQPCIVFVVNKCSFCTNLANLAQKLNTDLVMS